LRHLQQRLAGSSGGFALRILISSPATRTSASGVFGVPHRQAQPQAAGIDGFVMSWYALV